MPGPPAGPSYRMTTTSPGAIARAFTAAKHSSSESKTRAGPRCTVRSWPASFTTHPSGARLPRRIAMPPRDLSGVSIGTTTSWPSVSLDAVARPPQGCGRRLRRHACVDEPRLARARVRRGRRRRPREDVRRDDTCPRLHVGDDRSRGRRCGRSPRAEVMPTRARSREVEDAVRRAAGGRRSQPRRSRAPAASRSATDAGRRRTSPSRACRSPRPPPSSRRSSAGMPFAPRGLRPRNSTIGRHRVRGELASACPGRRGTRRLELVQLLGAHRSRPRMRRSPRRRRRSRPRDRGTAPARSSPCRGRARGCRGDRAP